MGEHCILYHKVLDYSLLRCAYTLNSSEESPYTIDLSIYITSNPTDTDTLNSIAFSVEIATETVLGLIVILHGSDRRKVGNAWHFHVVVKHIVCLVVLRSSPAVIHIRTFLIAEIWQQLEFFLTSDKIRIGGCTCSKELTCRDRHRNGGNDILTIINPNFKGGGIAWYYRLHLVSSACGFLFTIKNPTVSISCRFHTLYLHGMGGKTWLLPVDVNNLHASFRETIAIRSTIYPQIEFLTGGCSLVGSLKECRSKFSKLSLRTHIICSRIHIEDCCLYGIGEVSCILSEDRTYISRSWRHGDTAKCIDIGNARLCVALPLANHSTYHNIVITIDRNACEVDIDIGRDIQELVVISTIIYLSSQTTNEKYHAILTTLRFWGSNPWFTHNDILNLGVFLDSARKYAYIAFCRQSGVCRLSDISIVDDKVSHHSILSVRHALDNGEQSEIGLLGIFILPVYVQVMDCKWMSVKDSCKRATKLHFHIVHRWPPCLIKVDVSRKLIVLRVLSICLRYVIGHPCKIFFRADFVWGFACSRTIHRMSLSIFHSSYIKPFLSRYGYGTSTYKCGCVCILNG